MGDFSLPADGPRERAWSLLLCLVLSGVLQSCTAPKPESPATTCSGMSPTQAYNLQERQHDLNDLNDAGPDLYLPSGRGFVPDETAARFSVDALACWTRRNDPIAPYLLAGKRVGAFNDVGILARLTPANTEAVVGDLLRAADGSHCSETLEPPSLQLACEKGLPEAQFVLGILQRDQRSETLKSYPDAYWLRRAALSNYPAARRQLAILEHQREN